MQKMYNHILVSRTDAIGDVVLTLPVCGLIKTLFPGIKVSFLGRSYTEPVIRSCTAVDHFINMDELNALSPVEQAAFISNTGADVFIHVFPSPTLAFLAKKAKISLRIGTRNRWYHWLTCNKLVALSRKNSGLHESELNLRLLTGLGIREFPPVEELYTYYHFRPAQSLTVNQKELLSADKFNLVIHPKSHGSGAEWPLQRYAELISLLPQDKFKVFISGSAKEKVLLQDWISGLPAEKTVDLTGSMALGELIAFLNAADGLLASGTGPLHLAAATGIHTLGIFPASKPIHAGRWGPVGEKAIALSASSDSLDEVTAAEVFELISNWKRS